MARRAGRSHPPSLLKLAERTIKDHGLLGRGDTVLCACSGGPDSTALLHVLALLQKRIGHRVLGLGVDHGLRPEAPAELAIAAELAASLEIPFTIARVHVAPGSNLQARARDARLGALFQAASDAGAQTVATGHTADDRAETFLLRLLRGAGPKGLAVLPPRAPFPPLASLDEPNAAPMLENPSPIELIRPLLRARRADIAAHLHRHRLAFALDPSNLNPRFTRVRVRRELLPLLEDLSPAIVEHLSALADMLAEPGAQSLKASTLSGLGRAQRQAIGRAERLGKPVVEVSLSRDRSLVATFPDGKIVLTQAEPSRREKRRSG
ncbi:MAG: tRNA lysidine(34) synthetase TilS [Polyangiaceae bacterium]|nr:tRNA lysidine(34) synthetase TilS [Polyangiaceae bacterium]